MFRVIGTRGNGEIICMKDMVPYTVSLADTKETFMKEKRMDSEHKYSKMEIIIKAHIV